MHKYFIKTPWLVRKLFPGYLWAVDTNENEIYLSFDDGPHPRITSWVLDELNKYGAKASFFCIGNNVEKYPETYQRIVDEGHSVGNHTWSHMNGWKTSKDVYLEDVKKAGTFINTNLFRPPYGRIRTAQATEISTAMHTPKAKIVMWDVLSGDFDQNYSPEQCLENVLSNYERGSIVVFHDSEKAFANLKWVLPALLDHIAKEGFVCRELKQEVLK